MNQIYKIGKSLSNLGFYITIIGLALFYLFDVIKPQIVFIGVCILFIGLEMLALISLVKSVKKYNDTKKESTAIIVNSFLVMWSTIALIVLFLLSGANYYFKNSEAYKTVTKEIINNDEYESQLGAVKGFGLIVGGSLSSTNADLNIGIRAEKSNPRIRAKLEKKKNGSWKIVSISGIGNEIKTFK